VVDDICDSGVTIKEAPGVYTATLHYKKSAIVEPNIYASLLLNERQWLVYPWENEDSKAIQDYLVK
jgi:hypoxanthine phosphoribosyltransferase